MKVELIRSNGFGRRERVVIDDLPVMIGSDPSSGVRVNDRRVSRLHCLLAEYEGRLLVRDLNSKHGTFVNGARVKEVPLMPGDRLTVGKSNFIVSPVNGAAKLPSAGGEKTLFVVGESG